jgi:choline kinase
MARAHLIRPFVYLHADTIFHASILDDLLGHGGDAVLPIDMRPCEPEQMKARIRDGAVQILSKELPANETAGEFLGIGYFGQPVISALVEGMDAVLDAGGVSTYFEEAINWAIAERGLDVRAIATDERPWTEIDFPQDLELAKRILPSLQP